MKLFRDRDKENKRNLLLDEVKNIILLSDEEKAAIGDQVNELLKQQSLAAQQRDQAKKMTDWLDEKAQNEKKLYDKQQELTQQQELSQRPEYLERQQLVIDWEDTIEPRRESRDLLQATKQITELQALKPAMQEEYDWDDDMDESGRRGSDGRMYSGRSYRRGRDSMGRYADSGDMVKQLESLMESAPDDRTRQEIQKIVQKMRNR